MSDCKEFNPVSGLIDNGEDEYEKEVLLREFRKSNEESLKLSLSEINDKLDDTHVFLDKDGNVINEATYNLATFIHIYNKLNVIERHEQEKIHTHFSI